MFISCEFDTKLHKDSSQVRSTVVNMDPNANFDTDEVTKYIFLYSIKRYNNEPIRHPKVWTSETAEINNK